MAMICYVEGNVTITGRKKRRRCYSCREFFLLFMGPIFIA